MNILRTLHNPVLLGLQGFVVGAVLVWTTTPDGTSAVSRTSEPEIAALTGIPR